MENLRFIIYNDKFHIWKLPKNLRFEIICLALSFSLETFYRREAFRLISQTTIDAPF